jgi:hypothetical protein
VPLYDQLFLILSAFICAYLQLDSSWYSWRLGGSIIVLVRLGVLGGSVFDLIRVHLCLSVVESS